MSVYINDNSNHNNIVIDDIYKIYIVENVLEYKLIDFNTHSININIINNTTNNDIIYYFVIDLLIHDSFGHWVFESAIYLPIYKRLKEKYPNIKILLKEKKQYKILFIKFFDISEHDIIYDNQININNICFFPSPISALNDKIYFTDNYKKIIIQFITYFNLYETQKDKKYDCIILPRQCLENFKGNNREYNIENVYTTIEEKTKDYCIINTDNISNLNEQITMIRKSNIVIITDGSPFLVNNMFCKETNIYIIDNFSKGQIQQYIKYKFIIEYSCIINNNKYEYISDNTNILGISDFKTKINIITKWINNI